jgi:hypothetical protein
MMRQQSRMRMTALPHLYYLALLWSVLELPSSAENVGYLATTVRLLLSPISLVYICDIGRTCPKIRGEDVKRRKRPQAQVISKENIPPPTSSTASTSTSATTPSHSLKPVSTMLTPFNAITTAPFPPYQPWVYPNTISTTSYAESHKYNYLYMPYTFPPPFISPTPSGSQPGSR